MKTIEQTVGQSREAYLRKAIRFARQKFNDLSTSPDYRHCHESFALRDALLQTEKKFPDLGTFGVEYTPAGSNRRSPAITYLNAGDTYESTILYIRGRFRVGTWGDVVERGNYA